MITATLPTYTIKTSPVATILFKDGEVHTQSSVAPTKYTKGRVDHLDHIVAWCDSNGVEIANDPRRKKERGKWLLLSGEIRKSR